MVSDLLGLTSLALVTLRLGLTAAGIRLFKRKTDLHDLGGRLRRALDRRGLMYRKLGQYLAMRSDVLPPAICAELDRLFDDVTPMPFAEVERAIERETGRPWTESFSSVAREPLASASVAQVHRARARDGQDLALKIQRTGTQKRFQSEVRTLRFLARIIDALRIAGDFSIVELFDEFARFTGRELDFAQEGNAADRLRRDMPPYGYVPKVRWDLSTPRLLAMEFIEGEPVLTFCRLHEGGRTEEIARRFPWLDLETMVSQLAQECFKQLLERGFFHGDPHPGNVVVRPDGSFVFLDCGISGELSLDYRRDLRTFIESLALGRFTESAHDYIKLCRLTAATDIDALVEDLTAVLARWHRSLSDRHASLESRHMGNLQGTIAMAMRRHRAQTLPDQILVWRALVLMDGTALRLPVQFDLMKAMEAFFRKTEPAPLQLLTRAGDEWLMDGPRTLSALGLAGNSRPEVGIVRLTVTAHQRAAVQLLGSRGSRQVAFAAIGTVCAGFATQVGEGLAASICLATAFLCFLAAAAGWR